MTATPKPAPAGQARGSPLICSLHPGNPVGRRVQLRGSPLKLTGAEGKCGNDLDVSWRGTSCDGARERAPDGLEHRGRRLHSQFGRLAPVPGRGSCLAWRLLLTDRS